MQQYNLMICVTSSKGWTVLDSTIFYFFLFYSSSLNPLKIDRLKKLILAIN
jgi:hypothetical protein